MRSQPLGAVQPVQTPPIKRRSKRHHRRRCELEHGGVRRRCPVPRGRAVVAALPLLLLAGCSQLPGVGLRASGAGSGIEMHLAHCAADVVVTRARLTLLDDDGLANTEDDPVLWEITSEEGHPLDVITVGVTPAGFREVVPLGVIPEGAELHVNASPKLGGERFERSELRSDAVFWSGQYLSSEDFQEEARSRSQCNSGMQALLEGIAFFALIGALFVALPTAIIVGTRSRM